MLGVFTAYGAFVDSVINRGPVTTYGPNDMVLDNWGTVDHWVAEDKITSYGPSGIGFVNFGTVNLLQVNAPVETFGQGARESRCDVASKLTAAPATRSSTAWSSGCRPSR